MHRYNFAFILAFVAVFSLAAFASSAAAASQTGPTLTQFVGSCTSNNPIVGASVNIGGQTVTTNSNGYAFVNGLSSPSTYVAQITAGGFQPISEVVIIAPSVIPYNIPFYDICMYPSTGTDNNPPQVSLVTIPSGPITSAGPVTLSSTAYDSASTIIWNEVSYVLGNGQVETNTCSSSSCAVTIGPLQPGVTVQYWSQAADAAGNTNLTGPFSFTVVAATLPANSTANTTNNSYTLPPALNVWRDPGGQVAANGTVTIYASATSPNGISQTAIGYTVGSADQQTVYCSAATCNATIANIPASTLVAYAAIAVDNSASQLISQSPTFYFTTSPAVNGSTTNTSNSTVGPTGLPVAPAVSVTRTPAGQVLPTDTILFQAYSSSPNGVLWTQVSYAVNSGLTNTVSCPSNYCTINAGPFAPGTVVTYSAQVKDGSDQGLVGYSPSYTFTVGPAGYAPTNTTSTTTTTTSSTTSTTGNSGQQGLTCAVFANTSQVQAGSQDSITVQYSNAQGQTPSFSSVDCGNGQSFNENCFGTGPSSGMCQYIAACAYSYHGTYTVSSTINGVQCSSATVSVSGASQQAMGVLLVRTIDSGSYAVISGAQVTVNGEYAYTNAFGEATFNLQPGNYTVNATASNYQPNSIGTVVTSGQTTLLQAPLAMIPVNSCGVLAELTSNTCSQGNQAFTLRVASNATQTILANIGFSSPLTVGGPNTVQMPADQYAYLNYSVYVPQGYSGAQVVTATVGSNQSACAGTQLQIPLCPSSGISMQLQDTTLNARPDQTVCTNAIITNSGTDQQDLTFAAAGDYSSSFSLNRVILGGQASATVRYCVFVPDSADNTHTFVLTASSDSGLTAAANLQVDVGGQSTFALNYSNCNSTGLAGPSGVYAVTASAPGYTNKTQDEYVADRLCQRGLNLPLAVQHQRPHPAAGGSLPQPLLHRPAGPERRPLRGRFRPVGHQRPAHLLPGQQPGKSSRPPATATSARST